MADATATHWPLAIGYRVPDSAEPSHLLAGGPPPSYFQRVWDTSALVWCYYSSATIQPAPSAGSTSPNHSGSITNHQVLDVVGG